MNVPSYVKDVPPPKALDLPKHSARIRRTPYDTEYFEWPNDTRLEWEVLGCIWECREDLTRRAEMLDHLVITVTEDCFFNPQARTVFKLMRDLHEGGSVVDDATLPAAMQKAGVLLSHGPRVLEEMANNGGLPVHMRRYVKMLLELAGLRKIGSAGRDIFDLMKDKEADLQTLRDRALRILDAAVIDQREKSYFTMPEACEATDRYVMNPEPGTTPLSMNVKVVEDLFTSGDPGCHFLGAQTGGGKSITAINEVAYPAAMNGARVVIFSLEMPKEKVVLRACSKFGDLNYRRMALHRRSLKMGGKGELYPDEVARFRGAMDLLHPLPVIIDDEPGLTAAQIGSRLRRYKRELGGLDLVVVDHLHYMKHPAVYGAEHADQSETVQALTDIAKQTAKCPFLVLAQLNEKVWGRPDNYNGKRPRMSDFYSASKLKMCAITASILWKPSQFDLRRDSGEPYEDDRVVLTVVKNRDDGACEDTELRARFDRFSLGGEA